MLPKKYPNALEGVKIVSPATNVDGDGSFVADETNIVRFPDKRLERLRNLAEHLGEQELAIEVEILSLGEISDPVEAEWHIDDIKRRLNRIYAEWPGTDGRLVLFDEAILCPPVFQKRAKSKGSVFSSAGTFILEFFKQTDAPICVMSFAQDKSEAKLYPPKHIYTRDPEAIDKFAKRWDLKGRAIYFCVSTIKPKKKRSKANTAELTGVHADLDFGGIKEDQHTIQGILDKLKLKPRWINFSGNGMHLHFSFPKAMPATKENVKRVEAAMKRLANILAGDPSVCEVARPMRVPGTHNSKHGAWVECVNVADNKGAYHTLDELDTWIKNAEPLLHRVKPKEQDKVKTNGGSNPREAHVSGESKYSKLNSCAIENYDKWVPEIFPGAEKTGDGYRVSSTELGRDDKFSEDLAFHSEGIKDFGLHDGLDKDERPVTPDPLEGKRTPIDIVMQHVFKVPIEEIAETKTNNGHHPKFNKAVKWLCDKLDYELEEDDEQDEELPEGATVDDFVSYLEMHTYIYLATRKPWPAISVNIKLPKQMLGKKKVTASHWLDKNRTVEQITWAPGEPELIKDRLVDNGGWFEKKGDTCLNLYRPPKIKLGDATKAGRWLDLIRKVYPDDHQHIVNFLAQRVQQPGVKINHGLLLGGAQGIGKDTILDPVKRAVGEGNFAEVSPTRLFGRFTGYLKSIILRISEACDLGDITRYKFYDHTKALMASPPNTLECDEKNLREYYVVNVAGVILTTNHKIDGIYLPEDDRRHYVAWSILTKVDFEKGFWVDHWKWYDEGGYGDIAAYLHQHDLSGFDPKEPPIHTEAWWTIVNANRHPEERELSDTIDEIALKEWQKKNPDTEAPAAAEIPPPDAVTLGQISAAASGAGNFWKWLDDPKNSRAIPHRFDDAGYVRVRQPYSKDGFWVINRRRQAIYVRKVLSPADQIRAAQNLVEKLETRTDAKAAAEEKKEKAATKNRKAPAAPRKNVYY